MAKKLKEKEFKRTVNGVSCFCAVCHYLESNHISGAFCFKSKSFTHLPGLVCTTDTMPPPTTAHSSACLEGCCSTFVRDTCQCFLENKGLSIFMHKTVTLKLHFLSQRPTFSGTMFWKMKLSLTSGLFYASCGRCQCYELDRNISHFFGWVWKTLSS